MTQMYNGRLTRGMTFAAALMTFTASVAVAQDTITVASPDGRNRV
jgi:pyruvate-formate lyase